VCGVCFSGYPTFVGLYQPGSGVRLVFLAARSASLTLQKPRQRCRAVMVLRSHARKSIFVTFLCLRACRQKKLAHFRRQMFNILPIFFGCLPAPFHWRHGWAAWQPAHICSRFALPPLPPWRFFLYPHPPLTPRPLGAGGVRIIHRSTVSLSLFFCSPFLLPYGSILWGSAPIPHP